MTATASLQRNLQFNSRLDVHKDRLEGEINSAEHKENDIKTVLRFQIVKVVRIHFNSARTTEFNMFFSSIYGYTLNSFNTIKNVCIFLSFYFINKRHQAIVVLVVRATKLQKTFLGSKYDVICPINDALIHQIRPDGKKKKGV